MSRLLLSGENQITQSYASHVSLCEKKLAWARGIDIVKKVASCDFITAHSDGVVIFAGMDKNVEGYGNHVMILHDGMYVTLYAHLSSVNVKQNDKVKKGDVLGYMGSTGRSTGAHLHWEVRFFGQPVTVKNRNDEKAFTWIDPTPFLESDLPYNSGNHADYVNASDYYRVKNRWVDGVQKGAFKSYDKAVSCAKTYGYKVFDKNGIQVYPVNENEDYTKSTLPNRFRVKVGDTQIGAYTNYNGAVSQAKSRGGHVYDSANGMVVIW